MQVSTSSNTLTITGNIKSVNDYKEIKTATDRLISEYKEIIVLIENSLSITSSIIGYFNKIVLKDSIDLNMSIGNAQLMELLEDLNLTSVFKVRKI
jgi:hypothetical protein